MTLKLRKKPVLIAGFTAAAIALSGCTSATVGVGYNDPYYDSLLWNDYYHDINIDVDRPDRPDRPNLPDRPRPPIAKPPIAKPPAARPLPARPPIHRPSPRGRR